MKFYGVLILFVYEIAAMSGNVEEISFRLILHLYQSLDLQEFAQIQILSQDLVSSQWVNYFTEKI